MLARDVLAVIDIPPPMAEAKAKAERRMLICESEGNQRTNQSMNESINESI